MARKQLGMTDWKQGEFMTFVKNLGKSPEKEKAILRNNVIFDSQKFVNLKDEIVTRSLGKFL